MLVLSRKLGEQLRIGDDIIVTITKTSQSRVTIGIEAPSDVPILRGEIDVDRDGGNRKLGHSSFHGSHQD